jgi:hypothetical protein
MHKYENSSKHKRIRSDLNCTYRTVSGKIKEKGKGTAIEE